MRRTKNFFAIYPAKLVNVVLILDFRTIYAIRFYRKNSLQVVQAYVLRLVIEP